MSQAVPKTESILYVQVLKYQGIVVFPLRSFAHNDILRLLIVRNETREQAIRLTCVRAFSSDRDYSMKTCEPLASEVDVRGLTKT